MKRSNSRMASAWLSRSPSPRRSASVTASCALRAPSDIRPTLNNAKARFTSIGVRRARLSPASLTARSRRSAPSAKLSTQSRTKPSSARASARMGRLEVCRPSPPAVLRATGIAGLEMMPGEAGSTLRGVATEFQCEFEQLRGGGRGASHTGDLGGDVKERQGFSRHRSSPRGRGGVPLSSGSVTISASRRCIALRCAIAAPV